MINVILCGGSGTRLWPLSRQLFPKQFCPLVGERSLYQETISRNAAICGRTMVVTNADNFYMALEQYEQVAPQGSTKPLQSTQDANSGEVIFLLEPCPRNTAPAIALACLGVDSEEVVIVSPSDHLISDTEIYLNTIRTAQALAEKGFLVTFGIRPTYPETGYGYIESGDRIDSFGDDCRTVKAFHEKPDEPRAIKYLESGMFSWNSGMFAFKAGVFLAELKKYSPEIYEESVRAYNERTSGGDAQTGRTVIRIGRDEMMRIPSKSVDYAVMEKSASVAVISSSFGWNDLGSFDALYDVVPKDANGNTISAHTVTIDSRNNLIVSGKRKIATVGLSDSIVIDTPDALLVAKRGASQDVKKVVESLQKGDDRDQGLTTLPSKVARPWGYYTVLEEGEGYKIKRIDVKPGRRLSLQKHMHRSEHWVVVSGTATITVDAETRVVRINESTYIPIGAEHRLQNEGVIDLIIIETQVGQYLGEDDIIRIEDDYAR